MPPVILLFNLPGSSESVFGQKFDTYPFCGGMNFDLHPFAEHIMDVKRTWLLCLVIGSRPLVTAGYARPS
jgi:hypothetical protein